METQVPKRIHTHRSRKTGAVMVEYVFLIIFIVMVAWIGISTFGHTVTNVMGQNNNSVANAIQ
jgi:Flp pilus assembly pilin Flp